MKEDEASDLRQIQLAAAEGPETLEIILLLDPKGHIRAQKIIATPHLQWLNQMAEKVVRDARLPAMPAQLVAEHKGDLVPFATKWVYERKD